jgi:hypothetical protein
MADARAKTLFTCETSGEDYNLSFDCDMVIDDAEYSRIMRRVGIEDDGAATYVSAFNSSI